MPEIIRFKDSKTAHLVNKPVEVFVPTTNILRFVVMGEKGVLFLANGEHPLQVNLDPLETQNVRKQLWG